MKIAPIVTVLLILSLILNWGLIAGYVRIGTPEKFQEIAYNDSQRAMMNALVEDVR